MSSLLRATEAFFEYLAAIDARFVALAVAFHVAKLVVRSRSWRNILAAAYPSTDVRWRSVFGSYAAGVGVNAIFPARGGDLLKLYLVKRRIEGATYPTLAATLVVETLFDLVVASLLLVWALNQGVLPGLDVIPRLPEIDWLWLFQRPLAAAIASAVALAAGFGLGILAALRFATLRARLGQGIAILRSPRAYFRSVVTWQALDWACRLATIYFLLRAFGLPGDVGDTLLVQVANSLSTLLPLTPGGIGTEQALLVYMFSGAAPAAAVLSFSVGMRFVITAANVAVGFTAIALMLRTLRWRRAVDSDRATPDVT